MIFLVFVLIRFLKKKFGTDFDSSSLKYRLKISGKYQYLEVYYFSKSKKKLKQI